MHKKKFILLAFISLLFLSSCIFSRHYWEKGGLGAVALVGLDDQGLEKVNYVPYKTFARKINPPLKKLTKGMQEMLSRGDRDGRWRFGQFSLGLQLGFSVGIPSIYEFGRDNSIDVIFRKREFIY